MVVPSVSIAGGRGKEGDDDAITFTVTLGEATSETVSVDYATADGTAAAGADYTATSGTVRFSPGTTSEALAVAIADDIENESDETFTVTLSNPSGGTLATSSATGTIENRYVAPLTARFEGMPAEHDGTEFTFELHFSENVKTGYAKVGDRAFTVHEARIDEAKRKNPQAENRNQSWTIRVKPNGKERIGITLPPGVSLHRRQVDLHLRRTQAEPLDRGDGTGAAGDGRRRRAGAGGRRRVPLLRRDAQPQPEQRSQRRLRHVRRDRARRRRLHGDERNADDSCEDHGGVD